MNYVCYILLICKLLLCTVPHKYVQYLNINSVIILLNVILRIGCSLFCLQVKITSRRCCWSGQERPTARQNSSENNQIWWFQWWSKTFLIWKRKISFLAATKVRKLCRPECEILIFSLKFDQVDQFSPMTQIVCQMKWKMSGNLSKLR